MSQSRGSVDILVILFKTVIEIFKLLYMQVKSLKLKFGISLLKRKLVLSEWPNYFIQLIFNWYFRNKVLHPSLFVKDTDCYLNVYYYLLDPVLYSSHCSLTITILQMTQVMSFFFFEAKFHLFKFQNYIQIM